MIFLLNLAEKTEEYSQLGEIASKEGISEKYLENIVSKLKSTGVISVKRGARGGYKLSRAAHLITLKEILPALETSLSLELESYQADPHSVNAEVVRQLISDLQVCLIDFLKMKTIQDLVDAKPDYKLNQMFYI